MKAEVAQGVIWSGERALWVRYERGVKDLFRCGEPPSAGKGKTLCGLSGREMVFRETHLPFSREEQIRAVLPQEVQDTLIYRLEQPLFSWLLEPEDEAFRLLYAATEDKHVRHIAQRLTPLGIGDPGLVISEQALLPLLRHVQKIPQKGGVLVLDASQSPISLCLVRDSRLWSLRRVSPGAESLGDDAIIRDMAWLVEEMLEEQQGSATLLCVGRSEPFWGKLKAIIPVYEMQLISIKALGEGISGWEWARAAGLAFASVHGGKGLLMEFHLPGVGFGRWGETITIWRFPAFLGLLLMLFWGGIQGVAWLQFRSAVQRDQVAVKKIFRATLPQVPVMIDPRLQLKQALARIASGENGFPGFGAWLGSIQVRVDRSTEVQWLQVHFEAGEVRLQGEVPSYDHLEQVRTALSRIEGVKDVVVENAHIISKTKKVQFSLRLS